MLYCIKSLHNFLDREHQRIAKNELRGKKQYDSEYYR